MNEKEIILFDKTESIFGSWLKDLFTLFVIAFCVYISHGSTWWTFVTGTLFLLFVGTKLMYIWDKRKQIFSNKKDLLKYVKSMEDF